ncbi:MAG: hypothetical protein JWR83_2407, partial [Aeromicrobium sp.]|nr:hypothetical protein [Aeromicrobium sp.]
SHLGAPSPKQEKERTTMDWSISRSDFDENLRAETANPMPMRGRRQSPD